MKNIWICAGVVIVMLSLVGGGAADTRFALAPASEFAGDKDQEDMIVSVIENILYRSSQERSVEGFLETWTQSLNKLRETYPDTVSQCFVFSNGVDCFVSLRIFEKEYLFSSRFGAGVQEPVRLQPAVLLEKILSPSVPVEQVVAYLMDQQERYRVQHVGMVKKKVRALRSPREEETIALALTDEGKTAFREEFLQALRKIGGADTPVGKYAAALADEIEDRDIEQLKSIVHEVVMQERDDEKEIKITQKVNALRALARRYPANEKTRALVRNELGSRFPRVMLAAIDSVGDMKDRGVMDRLKRFLESPDRNVLHHTVVALAKIGDSAVVTDILPFLRGGSKELFDELRTPFAAILAREDSLSLLMMWEHRVLAVYNEVVEKNTVVAGSIYTDFWVPIKTKIADLDPLQRSPEYIMDFRTYDERPHYYEFASSAGHKYVVDTGMAVPDIRVMSPLSEPESLDPVRDWARLKMVKEAMKRVSPEGIYADARGVVGWSVRGGEMKVFGDRHDFRQSLKKEYVNNATVRFLIDRTVVYETKTRQGKPFFTTVDEMLDFLTRDTFTIRREGIRNMETTPRIATVLEDVKVGYILDSRTILPVIFKNAEELILRAQAPGRRNHFLTVLGEWEKFIAGFAAADLSPDAVRFKTVWTALCRSVPEMAVRVPPEIFQFTTGEEARKNLDRLCELWGISNADIHAALLQDVTAGTVQLGDALPAYRRSMLRLMFQISAARETMRLDIIRTAASHELAHFIHLNQLDYEKYMVFSTYAKRRIDTTPEIAALFGKRGFREIFVSDEKRKHELLSEHELLAFLVESMAYPESELSQVFRIRFDDLTALDQMGLVPPWFSIPMTKDDLVPLLPTGIEKGVKKQLLDYNLTVAGGVLLYRVPQFASDDSINNLIYQDLGKDAELLYTYKIDPGQAGFALTNKGKQVRSIGQYVVIPDPRRADTDILVASNREVVRSLFRCKVPKEEGKTVLSIFAIKRPEKNTTFDKTALMKESLYALIVREDADFDGALRQLLMLRMTEFNPVLAGIIDTIGASLLRLMGTSWSVETIDQAFLAAHAPDVKSIDRDFGERGREFTFSPSSRQQQIDYFIFIYALYRQLRLPTDDSRFINKEQIKQRSIVLYNRYIPGIEAVIDIMETELLEFIERIKRDRKVSSVGFDQAQRYGMYTAIYPAPARMELGPDAARLFDVAS